MEIRFSKVSLVLVTIVLFYCGEFHLYAQEAFTEGRSIEREWVSVLKVGDFSLQPGLRIQIRYSYDEASNNNDIMIRRTRIKAKGEVANIARYYLEIKFDNVAQEEKTQSVAVENAFVSIPFDLGPILRIGQYDVPFSLNQLTSDSKLLFMDTALIVDELKKLGLVDNTQGLLVYGRPLSGLFEYGIGIFDNEVFEKRSTDASREKKWTQQLMGAGRLAIHLLSQPKLERGMFSGTYVDNQASFFDLGRRLTIGMNFARLGGIHDDINKYALLASGVDVSGNYGSFVAEAEIDRFKKDMESASVDVDIEGEGWYVQGGYLLPFEAAGFKFEPSVRYQKMDPDKNTSGGWFRWTSIGINAYRKGHNLKVQMEYVAKDESGDLANNTYLMQGQLDF